MKCDICKSETENYTTKEGMTICVICYANYLKWKLTRGELASELKTYKRKYKKCG